MDFIKRLFCKKSSCVNRPLSLETMPSTVASANIKIAEENDLAEEKEEKEEKEENDLTENFFYEIKHERRSECWSDYGVDEDEDEEDEPEPLTGNWATTMMTNEDAFEEAEENGLN